MLYQSIERFDAHSQFSNIQGRTVSNQSNLFKKPGFSPRRTGSFQTFDVALGHRKQAIRMNRQYRCRKGRLGGSTRQLVIDLGSNEEFLDVLKQVSRRFFGNKVATIQCTALRIEQS